MSLHFLPVPATALAPITPAGRLPTELASALETMEPVRLEGLTIDGAVPRYHPEAAFWAAQYTALLKPAPHEVIKSWLMKFGASIAVANRGVDEHHVLGWIAGVIIASGSLAGWVWSAEAPTLMEAIQQFDWWPAPAKLHPLLLRHDQRLRREARFLRACADASPGQVALGRAREASKPDTPTTATKGTPVGPEELARLWRQPWEPCAPVRSPAPT